MTVRKDLTSWQPRELVLEAGQQSFEAFLAGCEARFFLLILLDEPNSELATGLLALEASRLAGETDGLAFRTVVRDLDSFQEKSPASNSTQKLPRVMMSQFPEKGRIDRIPPEMLRQPCHIVPIMKRAEGGSFLQHVSVGRARNHDIVLRHRSVSKFHAWFEIHDASRLLVKDQESRNHTFVDGQQVNNRVEVFAGQTVRFGSVEARICTPESLWAALHP